MLRGSIQGKRHLELFRAISQHRVLDGGPSYFDVAGQKRSVAGWQKACLTLTQEAAAFWRNADFETVKGFSYLPGSELVHFTLPITSTFLAHVGYLESLPFETVTMKSDCREHWGEHKYSLRGFGRSMADHGLAAIFRGAGHDRLVSRRWLDFGPWRVIHRPNDTTVIQFHDHELTDGVEAYAQAAPGHQRMGVDPIGGYIQGIDLDVIAGVRGLYLAKNHTLEIVVAPGIEVRQQDMRVACGLRLHHKLTRPTSDRIDTIAYVFIDRADAETHLHELWLRELQCWYVDERGKHRLDDTYHPTPNPPDWVKRLNERDAGK
jgi:hypothetical protein